MTTTSRRFPRINRVVLGLIVSRCSVVTVHGARDDHQTAWTARNDDSNWILCEMFSGLSVRQLDYVYDTGNSARIYDPSANGITVEANALLNKLAQNRAELPSTEKDRPIIWICHDLGGSIVKQALNNAIHTQPDFDLLDVLDSPIFLACPHGNESKEELEDQLFALLNLPGPPVQTQTLRKITNLSRQIEKINLEFLETNVMDRAHIINFTGQEKNETQANATMIPQTAAQDTNADNQVINSATDLPTTPHRIFSVHHSAMVHNLGLYYTLPLVRTDHLDLVRGDEPSELWDRSAFPSKHWNNSFGFDLRVVPKYLSYQNSLLSLLPPTRVTKFRFFLSGAPNRPALMSWIIEHDALQKQLCQRIGPRTLHLHAGSSRHEVIDMKLVSQQLYNAYELAKREMWQTPDFGCFYFDFDQHDSRRAGIKAMIVSFLCTYECRLQSHESPSHPRSIDTWSLKQMISVFLEVQATPNMKDLTIILGRIDQCDEKERSIFLQAVLEHQRDNELYFNLLITTTGPEGFLCDILPPGSTINLDDCSLPLNDYLVCPRECATEERIQRLIARRPEFTHSGPQFSQILGQFKELSSLQEKAFEWLSNYKCGSSTDEVTDMVQKVSSSPHQALLNATIDKLSAERQRIAIHIYDWVKFASEPLTLEILAEAVRYSLPQETARLQYIENLEEFSRFVEQVMGGIILKDGRDLIFSDDSFYDVSTTREVCAEQNHIHRPHADMATVCLRYLLGTEGQEILTHLSVDKQGMDDVSWSPIALPRHSLVSYALRFWTAHYRAAGDHRPIELATELLQDMTKRAAWAEAVYVVSNPFTRTQREYISSLPYMAMFGLDDLVLKQIEHGKGENRWNQDHWLAIAEAARNGHATTVTLLLEHTDMDSAGLREAVHWAARCGQAEALDCLVPKAQALEDFSWPPNILEHAIVAGLENLVLALVQAGYDLNEGDSTDSCRAAHLAVRYSQDNLLKILLDSGRVDLRLENDVGQTPLALAAHVGTAASIRHLLDAGASPEAGELGKLLYDTINYGNHKSLEMLIDAKIFSTDLLASKFSHLDESDFPLMLAVTSGFVECTRVLLDNGVDPNVTCEKGSALYQAIGDGPFLDVCRVLLDKGADPNESTTEVSVSSGGNVPLVKAAGVANKLMVEMLLEHEAKINVADPNSDEHDTPLSRAIANDLYDVMELLLKRGADPNLICESKPDAKLSFPPLYTAISLVRDSRFVEALINHDAKIDWARSDGSWTNWHAAYDSTDTMSLLLRKGADINAVKADGWTALMLAVEYKEKRSVEFLLKQTNPKADLEIYSKSDLKSTVLHLACEFYDVDILKMLLEAGADVNSQRSDGAFPLSLLIDFNARDCEDGVAMILKRKPNLELSGSEGCTVLHRIRDETPLSVVMRLVEEGAPVNAVDDRGHTPLSWAVECGNINVARYLTTVKGVKCNIYHPTFGSILHMAAAKSTLEMVRQLVKTGAEPSVVDPAFGESVLYSAIGNSNEKERAKIIRYLVEEVGVDVNAVGGEWGCPLRRVVGERWEKSLLKYLLRHGARTDHTDTIGRTAVHWAVLHDDLYNLKTLVKFGADLSVADNFGRTPLHFATTRYGDFGLIQYILEKLPKDVTNINIADVDGWTPLMWACRSQWFYLNRLALVLIDEYKADAGVRSKDGQWSPLKLAALHCWDEEYVELLARSVESQGIEKSRISQDRETKNEYPRYKDCESCLTVCQGQTWICPTCHKYLCFKCIPHSGEMHNPEHTFVDLDEYERVDEGSDADAAPSAHEGKSVAGSENEEGETDSESEEEDEEEDTD
ncbi:ankyrin repeat-containing domain protein [Diaporthe sp. PMI_573]|nr:ankyrin repeat-containing domain protein [Diaporthaceae sp. PMI_573]